MAGTTNDKLNLLRQTKEAFRTAITGKGQTISADEPFSAWPAKVAAITSGGGGGAVNAVNIMSYAKQNTLSVTDLPKEYYGYLLDCDTLMIYCGSWTFDDTDAYICSALCYIGDDYSDSNATPNRAITSIDNTSIEYYEVFESVSVTEENGAISVTINAKPKYYFAADALFRIVGLKI